MEKGEAGSGMTNQPENDKPILMEKGAARSGMAANQPGAQAAGAEKDTPSASSAPPRQRKEDWTPEERNAAAEFIRALIEDYHVYEAMTEEDVEEEYRRAGKLDKYDPERELQKRSARVAKKHPPPPGFYPGLEECIKLGDDEED